MKSRCFLMLLTFASPLLLPAQEKAVKPAEVPTAVRAAVTKRFPNAQVSKWVVEEEGGKTTYEASITDASGKRDAVFEEDGMLIAIEEPITISALPSAVTKTLENKYPGATLRKAEKITRGQTIQYEVDLSNAPRKEVVLSATGKIVKEE